MEENKYDVAISCRKEDEPTARALYEMLEGRVKSLFLYTQRQEEIAGEDGVEAFTGTYARQSRIVVVFYREGWGKTPWTAVEERAITDLVLREHRRVIVYSTDGTSPSWLPSTLLYASAQYGLNVLAAVVERKVQEEGGAVGPEDVVEMAGRVNWQRAAEERREARRFTEEAVHTAHGERRLIYARLKEQVDAIEVQTPGLVAYSSISGFETVRTVEAGIGFRWEGNCANSIQGDKLRLIVGDPGRYGWRDENSHTAERYELFLAEDESTWFWVDRKGMRHSSTEVADDALRLLLKEHEKRKKAQLDRRRRG